MNKERQFQPRVIKRFKMLCLSAVMVFGFQGLVQHTINGASEIQIEENENKYGSFFFVGAERKLEEEGMSAVMTDSPYACANGGQGKCNYDGKTWNLYSSTVAANGFIEEWADERLCLTSAIVPGSSLLPDGLLGIVYLIFLGYLFFGIAIISDIFMEAIEEITSQTKTLELWDKQGKQKCTIEVPVWNATVANLTLMALGSSAPEIMLSVIGTVQDLDALPPVLGPSTIVGSAAFNLLVISGLSILAVGEKPKKVNDVGVFAVTSLASLWAYIWLFICLTVNSEERVTVGEAWWTLVFFFALIIFAYTADRVNTCLENKKKTHEQLEAADREAELNIAKGHLRQIAKERGETVVLEVAQGIQTKETLGVSDLQRMEIISLYKQVLNINDLGEADINDLLNILQPDSLLERFAYRKRNAAGTNQEFLKLKGAKGQIDHDLSSQRLEFENQLLGFKCLHYSVTESNGQVEITVTKKVSNQDLTFGYRTVEDTAKPPKDYTHIEEVVTMKKRDQELKIGIPIVDDDEWEPDLDFYVELFDPNMINPETGLYQRLGGDDTRCKVTILDEDFPGTLGFEQTDLRVAKSADKVEICVIRQEGADGSISCVIRTEPLSETQTANNAEEYEDYVPIHQKVVFLHGETEKIVSITLVKEKVSLEQKQFEGEKEEEQEESSQDEQCDLLFKVKIDKPEPTEVKISKKNVALVTIVRSDEEETLQNDKARLLEFYLAQKDPTWSQQFKNAVMLGPQIDEDNVMVEEVSGSDAAYHFITIFWKVIFAIVPPTSIMGGYPAFVISLALIGCVTAIVGSVATVLGCALGIEESTTAITLVALGTSLPDTFASMTAARNSEYADSAIGNVTGSNSVNVFLGLGLPWAIAATHWANKPADPATGLAPVYPVPAGAVAFSVFVFLMVAILCFMILIGRRLVVGGELGGPTNSKRASCAVLIVLWVIYIILSILNGQGVIKMIDG